VLGVDDICIAHLGDLGHLLAPEQLKLMKIEAACPLIRF
jgi:hypothetical protein